LIFGDGCSGRYILLSGAFLNPQAFH
jgi:hypothetical protein